VWGKPKGKKEESRISVEKNVIPIGGESQKKKRGCSEIQRKKGELLKKPPSRGLLKREKDVQQSFQIGARKIPGGEEGQGSPHLQPVTNRWASVQQG